MIILKKIPLVLLLGAIEQRQHAPEIDIRTLFTHHTVQDIRSVSLSLARDAAQVQHAQLPCHSLATYPSYLDETTRWQIIGKSFFVLFCCLILLQNALLRS